MEKGNIKPIDRTSVHKICSGQVVLTLATAVKELVENSIDAGATSIEVKLKDHGSESIEVIDNGKGVKASDFQSLTLKHHTSKIGDFSDVPFVSTFGFRGEALSSLCALSDLEVTTRHLESDVGTTLSFDHNGTLVKSTPTHRPVGTTVELKNIFSTFPVRHKEFLKHVKKEYLKMVQLLSAYCLISVKKRITCSNITETRKKSIVLSTNNSESYKDNIIGIFGDKQVKQLMEIVQHEPSKDILNEYFLPETASETSRIFKLEGYISNSTHGEGRSSSDRQFFFINGRPCDLPKVSKLINEIYHSFNKHQYPFVFLNVILNEGCADVNVTPDKRQIFIPDEKVLFALIKTTLLGMFGKQPSQMTISPLNFEMQKSKESSEASSLKSSPEMELECNNHLESTLKRKLEKDNNLSDEESPFSSLKNQRLDTSNKEDSPNIFRFKEYSLSNEQISEKLSQVKEITMEQSSARKLSSAATAIANVQNSKIPNTGGINFTMTLPFNEDKMFKKISPKKTGNSKLDDILNSVQRGFKSPNEFTKKSSVAKKTSHKSEAENKILTFLEKLSESKIAHKSDMDEQEDCLQQGDNFSEVDANDSMNCSEMSRAEDDIESSLDEPMARQKKYKNISFNMEMFQKRSNKEEISNENSQTCSYRRFRSKIAPTENQNAEEELKKEISKDSFSQMEIIGQFNLGFIIARLHDDLFIIDQHATDEKYNFEQLQKNTTLETQQLLQPQELNLSAVSEATLLDNLQVFEMNGFHFKINEENSSGQRVQLVSVPVSHNWRFGKEDVDELIFMLTDNPIRMVRPSRVNQMFASRACRKSVMIGTALTVPMMKKLVIHMGEIEQPWNCPHGRPTIRHLLNLNILKPVP